MFEQKRFELYGTLVYNDLYLLHQAVSEISSNNRSLFSMKI